MSNEPHTNGRFVHNTDLDPGEGYLATLPRIRVVLNHPALLRAFRHYDQIANSEYRLFRLIGAISLCLGAISLVGITSELLFAAIEVEVPSYITSTFEVCAVISILLALATLVGSTRTRWLVARFMTERIRQWHFQMFLDGNLISTAWETPEVFETERDKRWARFMSIASSAQGAMGSFVDDETRDLYHPQAPYPDHATAEESLRAYYDLRFEKQMSFFKFKREHFAVRDDWSEAVARWMILFGLLLVAGQLIVVIKRHVAPIHASRIMFAAAIVLVILSAIIRVYRSALAVASQRERYEAKWVRLVGLRTAYERSSTVDEKLELMKEVELIEIEELRDFLRQMRRASYLL